MTSIALNYKGIPYRTEWVEFPDIGPLLISLGVKPNPPEAFAEYTLPAIHDPRTGTTVMDSLKIIAYLDDTYPDTPAMFPSPTRSLTYAFHDALYRNVMQHLSLLLAPILVSKLNAPGQVYLRTKLEIIFGCQVEDIVTTEKRVELWTALEKGLGVVASWFDAPRDGRLLLMGGSGADGSDGPLCHADTCIAGFLVYARLGWGEESEEWRRIESFDGGRWKRSLKYFDTWVDTSH